MELVEILKRLNWVDILCIILMLRISYVAFQDGLSHEIFPLIGSVAVVVISLHYYSTFGLFISQNIFNIPVEISNFLSFLIMAIIALFIVKLLKALLDKVVTVQWHPLLEKFGGLLAGVFRAAIVTSLVLIILLLAPLPYFHRSIRDKSVTGMYFLKIGPTIHEKVSRFLPTIKLGAPLHVEDIVGDLTMDKYITPQARETKEKPAK